MAISIDSVLPVTRDSDKEKQFDAAPEKLLSGAPGQTVWITYSNSSNNFHAGIWSSDICELSVDYTEDELCVILTGVAELEDATGGTKRFAKGDSFVIPAGFKGIWRSLEPVSKIYAVYE